MAATGTKAIQQAGKLADAKVRELFALSQGLAGEYGIAENPEVRTLLFEMNVHLRDFMYRLNDIAMRCAQTSPAMEPAVAAEAAKSGLTLVTPEEE